MAAQESWFTARNVGIRVLICKKGFAFCNAGHGNGSYVQAKKHSF